MEVDLIKKTFAYRDGELYRIRGSSIATRPIGHIISLGYKRTTYWCKKQKKDKYYYNHRLIWSYHFGNIPNGKEIDHIDGNKLNNNIENLRLVNRSQNSQNKKSRFGKSKFKGVKFRKDYKNRPWQARINVNYKDIYLGAFFLEEDAACAYNLGVLTYYGSNGHFNNHPMNEAD